MRLTKSSRVFFCSHRKPPGDKECREMLWSEARACKRCPRDDCYRQGWSRDGVTADNLRLVKAKNKALEEARG